MAEPTGTLRDDPSTWLLESGEPWTRYRTLVDLLGRPEGAPEVRAARDEMLAHPQVQALMAQAARRGERPLRRHNDAGHPTYALSTLADFGLRATDPGMPGVIEDVLAHQSGEGALLSLVNIPVAFGGSGEDAWSWLICDAPTLLYATLAMGLGSDPRVRRALEHLVGCVAENGWRCVVAPELGRFRGPGRRDDPCPIANVYALKALAQVPGLLDSAAARSGVEALLRQWERRGHSRPYLFGMGTEFRRLKYPFVWYDILHVADVLSRFALARNDPRLHEMVAAIAAQADEEGRYAATSMYRAWRGWSFADKKAPSPWLTFLVARIARRLSQDLRGLQDAPQRPARPTL